MRDLHVFFDVVQSGSMAKAAAQLRVKQPSVSDRSPQVSGQRSCQAGVGETVDMGQILTNVALRSGF